MELNIKYLNIELETLDGRGYNYNINLEEDKDNAFLSFEEKDGYKEILLVMEMLQFHIINYIKTEVKDEENQNAILVEYMSRVLRLIDKGYYEVKGHTLRSKVEDIAWDRYLQMGDGRV